jgi:hypothetical protein
MVKMIVKKYVAKDFFLWDTTSCNLLKIIPIFSRNILIPSSDLNSKLSKEVA